jgi:hypothetical protein
VATLELAVPRIQATVALLEAAAAADETLTSVMSQTGLRRSGSGWVRNVVEHHVIDKLDLA